MWAEQAGKFRGRKSLHFFAAHRTRKALSVLLKPLLLCANGKIQNGGAKKLGGPRGGMLLGFYLRAWRFLDSYWMGVPSFGLGPERN